MLMVGLSCTEIRVPDYLQLLRVNSQQKSGAEFDRSYMTYWTYRTLPPLLAESQGWFI